MANTGIKRVLTLKRYVDGKSTSSYKPNLESDPDYIAPFLDTSGCPLSEPEVITPVNTPPPPPGATTMNHFVVDTDGVLSDNVNITTLLEGESSTYNFSIYAPSGYYWSSIPTFTSDTAGCSATASIVAGSNDTQIFVVVTFVQQAEGVNVNYTYSSASNTTLIPVQDSITWSSGTSTYVGSTGDSPVTQVVSGTVTVVGSDRTYRAFAANQFNYENNVTTTLTVNGVSSTATTISGQYGTFYGSNQTISEGTYAYTIEVQLSLASGLTTGAGVGGVNNL